MDSFLLGLFLLVAIPAVPGLFLIWLSWPITLERP